MLRTFSRGLAVLLLGLVVLAGGPAGAERLIGSGSGFVVNPGGWVVTNAHVVEGCQRIEVEGHGTATRLVRDDDNDLAALQVGTAGGVGILPLRLTPGRLAEPAHALGYPLGDVLSQSIKVTSGSISALAGLRNDSRLLQLSTPMQPGNSGGPVIDDSGHVIGVATSRLRADRFPDAQNVNFAVKASVLAEFLNANGIAFRVAEAAGQPAPLPDVVEAAVPAVLSIRCHGTEEPRVTARPQQPVRPTAPAPPAMRYADGYDVVGFDYRVIQRSSLPACEAACLRDRRCQAFTLNRRHAVCFLKEDGLILLGNADAVGAYRAQLSSRVVRSSFRVMANTDAPQGDYARLRGVGFVECYLECEMDMRCRGFAYVTERRDCWLKDRIGPLRSQRGVELGLR